MASRLQIEFEGGERAGARVPLEASATRLGASTKNDIVVRAKGVAFKHAVVHHEDGACVLEVLSRLHTHLNGEPLGKGRHPLGVGDRIELGEERLALRLIEQVSEPLPEVEGAPRTEQPLRLAELTSGDLIRGAMLGRDPELLRLRQEDGTVTEVLPEELADLTPVEGPLRQWRPAGWPLQTDAVSVERLGEELFADADSRAYVLLDGSLVPPERLAELRPGATCLIRGRLPADRVYRAPYLLPLTPGALAGLDPAWGILLRSPAETKALARLLRSFLRVTDARGGETLQFRSFDPRVLRRFLRTLDEDGAATFFGGACSDVRACPVCDTDLSGLDCSWCSARFDAEGFMISALYVPDGEERIRFAPGRPRPLRGARGRARLIVRAEQLDALGDRVALADELEAHVREAFRRRCRTLGDDGVRTAVRTLVARAGAYNLWDPYNVTRFVDVAFLVGLEFERQPWAWTWLEVLYDGRETAEARMDRVWALAKQHHAQLCEQRQPAEA